MARSAASRSAAPRPTSRAARAIDLYETTIEELCAAYSAGTVTCVEVAAQYLTRIGAFDRAGAQLNSVVVLNPGVFDEAAESDRRWRQGTARPLEGVPFTVKDSYMVRGLTVAAGSPAFANLIAQWDAFSVAQLRAAGAVLIGKTNMPPMADGGMQRGLYGRAESPYNPAYLAAAYASGSSNGSGVATAANFAVFGMGEETVSSGRSPASNNALCAYTPSWGVISIRGNWPLFPARDVVVPHTRSMGDLLRVLDCLVADDDTSRGDFWRAQRAVPIPPASQLRPADYLAETARHTLRGVTLGVPRMYLGDDPNFPIAVRDSVRELWRAARARLESLGATIVEVDFPLIERYEGDQPAGENIARLGVLPAGWMDTEFRHFLSYGWDDFLRANGDPALPELAAVDPDRIFPLAPGTLPDRYAEVEHYEERYRETVALAAAGLTDPRDRDDFADGLRALVRLREELFENWLAERGFDAVVFPANADVARESADVDREANDHAWENGVLFSNGNYALRHLGIPTVTVPMGTMRDTGMPVGLTFAGAAYRDTQLLGFARDFADSGSLRTPPAFAPPLVGDLMAASDAPVSGPAAGSAGADGVAAGDAAAAAATAGDAAAAARDVAAAAAAPELSIAGISTAAAPDGAVAVTVTGGIRGADRLEVTLNGQLTAAQLRGDEWIAQAVVPGAGATRNPAPPSLLVVACAARGGRAAADFVDLPLTE